jgi:outer membrane protein
MTHFNFRTIVLFSFVVLAGALSAQDAWSLSDCINHARTHNIDVQKGENALELARINSNQSKMAFLPSLNLSGGYYWNVGLTIDPITNTRQPGSRQTMSTTAQGNWTLYNGGRNWYQWQQSRMNEVASVYQAEEIKNNVFLNIASSYLQILVNEQLLQVAEGQRATSEKNLERTSLLFENGAISKDNYLQSIAQLRADEGNVISASNALVLSKLMLFQLLQLEEGFDTFDIVRPEVDLTAGAMAGYHKDGLVEHAVQEQPSVKLAKANEESASYGLKLAKAGYQPSLGFSSQLNSNYVQDLPYFTEYYTLTTFTLVENPLTGSVDMVPSEVNVPNPNSRTDYTVSNQLKDNWNQFVGVGLQIPLFNGGQTHSAVQRAKIQQHNAALEVRQSELSVKQTIERAYLDAQGALAMYQGAKASAEASELALSNAQLNFNAGTISAFDLGASKNQYLASKSREIQSKYDYLFKVKVLEFYLFKQITL